MQVFMPFPSFAASVQCLDKSRLGNQIWREGKTLISGGWKHHPAAIMWADYKPALALYCLRGLQELNRREDIRPQAYHNLWDFFLKYIPKDQTWLLTRGAFNALEVLFRPPYIGNEDYHRSHRLNLLWKDPQWYTNYFSEPVPTSKPDYIWPSPQKIGSGTELELPTSTTISSDLYLQLPVDSQS